MSYRPSQEEIDRFIESHAKIISDDVTRTLNDINKRILGVSDMKPEDRAKIIQKIALQVIKNIQSSGKLEAKQ